MSTSFNEQKQAVRNQLLTIEQKDITPYKSFDFPPHQSLLAKPSEQLTKHIQSITHSLRTKFPEQYYYQPEQYHATLIAIKSQSVPTEIKHILHGHPLSVIPSGIGMNAYGMAVPLYPEDPQQLLKLRATLHKSFGAIHNYSEHASVWESMLWVNFMRFKTKPSQDFLDFVRHMPETQLDRYTISSWTLTELWSRVLESTKTKHLATFRCD